MLRLMMLVVLLVVAASGCRHTSPPLRPVVIRAGSESQEPCIERVLRRVRAAGYVEQTADRIAGFVRVPFSDFDSAGRRRRTVDYFQIQCSPDNLTATVVVAGFSYGEGRMPKWMKNELEDFTAQLLGF